MFLKSMIKKLKDSIIQEDPNEVDFKVLNPTVNPCANTEFGQRCPQDNRCKCGHGSCPKLRNFKNVDSEIYHIYSQNPSNFVRQVRS